MDVWQAEELAAQRASSEQRREMADRDAADRLEYWLAQKEEPPSQFRSDIERLIRMARR